MSKKKLLIVTYYWPPAGGPGVQRWLKFAKYFDALGHDVHILTIKDGHFPQRDESLAEGISESINVHLVEAKELLRHQKKISPSSGKQSLAMLDTEGQSKSLIQWTVEFIRANFILPDARRSWVPNAIKSALMLHQKEHFDCIITTGPPHSTHFIGKGVQKKTGLKWIADLRDPWSEIFYYNHMPRTFIGRTIDKIFEKQVLHSADHVVYVSESMKKTVRGDINNLSIITNGFDHEDLEKALVQKVDGFRLSYIGTFFTSQNIPHFWGFLKNYLDTNPIFASTFKLRLIGNQDISVLKSIEENGLNPYLEKVAYLPHQEAVTELKSATALLFVVPDAPNNKSIVPGKLFEYIGSGRPIVGYGPADSDASVILKEYKGYPLIDFNDTTSIVSHWEQIIKDATKTEQADLRLSRKYLAETYLNVIESLTNK